MTSIALGMILAAFGIAGAASAQNPPGDNRNVQVHSEGWPPGDHRNQPKVCNPYLDAFGFDAGQVVTYRIYANPPFKGTPVLTGTIVLDEHGNGVTNPLPLPNGMYKLVWTFTGEHGKAKHKVFKVLCEAPPTSPPPTTAPPPPTTTAPPPTTTAPPPPTTTAPPPTTTAPPPPTTTAPPPTTTAPPPTTTAPPPTTTAPPPTTTAPPPTTTAPPPPTTGPPATTTAPPAPTTVSPPPTSPVSPTASSTQSGPVPITGYTGGSTGGGGSALPLGLVGLGLLTIGGVLLAWRGPRRRAGN